MKRITQHIPNALTCVNLFLGCFACYCAFKGIYMMAANLMLLAAVFDFLDGFAARALNAYSKMGKELDSLADVVSFGVVPGAMLFSYFHDNLDLRVLYASVAFLLPVFSALRLAKFNIDSRQTSSFLGLPTPANAIFWAFLVVALDKNTAVFEPAVSFIILLSVMAIFCLFLVAEIPMFSLKFKNFSWKKNKTQVIFLVISLLLLIFLQWTAFPVIIGLYIVMSLIHDRIL
jgi:CDP-diacylglycerol--serine O-phosphatidyltransferase